jgi:hypothetical protein
MKLWAMVTRFLDRCRVHLAGDDDSYFQFLRQAFERVADFGQLERAVVVV